MHFMMIRAFVAKLASNLMTYGLRCEVYMSDLLAAARSCMPVLGPGSACCRLQHELRGWMGVAARV